MSQPLRLALIGASKIAHKITPALQALSSHIKITGVASSSIERAQAFCKTHALPKAYASYDEALHSPDVDAVYISLLNKDHYGLSKQALLAGKHVLCEKPLALKHAHVLELVQIAEQKSLILQEGLMYRFHPDYLHLIEQVKGGQLGIIHSIRASFLFQMDTLNSARQKKWSGGGSVADLGCYLIDFSNSIAALTGDHALPQIIAHAKFAPNDPDSVDQKTIIHLTYPQGLTALLDTSISQTSSNLWEISGERGSIALLRSDPQGSSSTPLITSTDESQTQLSTLPPIQNPLEQFQLQFLDFAARIRGERPKGITPDESIKNAQVLEHVLDLIKLPNP